MYFIIIFYYFLPEKVTMVPIPSMEQNGKSFGLRLLMHSHVGIGKHLLTLVV